MPISISTPVARSGRTIRRPQHSFQLRQRPWQIQPFALVPVLPGDTLQNALLQARVISDPIKNPLVGWWFEMYLFYVKHRDMPNSNDFQNMVLQYGYDMTSTVSAAKAEHYHNGGTVDWVDQCQRAVIPHYFRDDGELTGIASIGNLPAAKINSMSWLDSVIPDSQMVQGGATPAAGSPISATDLLLQQFQLMRELKMTTMTYEEFLKSYGVQPETAEQPNKPELLRYVRDWNYPSNTVSAVDGSSASALVWTIAERADKDRYFAEPGFIFGCAVARPKVYVSKQVSNASQLLTDALTWLPAILQHKPEHSLKKVTGGAGGTGPLGTTPTENYWVDVRDLFVYGDQFMNFAPSAADASTVALPTATLNKKYPTAADADGLFKATTSNLVRSDGVLALTIAGNQADHT